ncbi:Whey acidic protein [Amphibalanus amphitrite]|uniref:Whey acidic protein n=1 Tax=Amphibalanus amphitrite TaxID=1232801 RepID=A0A6A4W1W2_AMPAM|nr:Whey acidic protein [Amphibalanus amphitrite]
MASWIVLLLLAPAISAYSPREKPGTCISRVFPAQVCQPCEIVRLCSHDGNCPGTQKCCRTDRCVTQCEEPAGSSNCDVDTDCGTFDNRKCCKNTSGFTRCAEPRQEKPGKCINRVFIALACEPHEVVKLCSSDGDCPGTKKCCQTDRCVTSCEEPAEKPGKCIRRVFIALACEPHEIVKLCSSDGDCPGTKKCCQTDRCVTSCEEPAAPKPGECPAPSQVESGTSSRCDVDTDCGENNDKKCCKNASGFKRCASPPSTAPKPGQCPAPSQVESGTSSRCDVDTDCGENNDKKCCKNASGFKRCASPPSTEKPGKCIRRVFIALACRPQEIVKLCSSDGDCPGTKKCCQTERCVTSCEEPAGQCPDTSGIITTCEFDPERNCLSDSQCPSDKLCCSFGCGKECLKPVS